MKTRVIAVCAFTLLCGCMEQPPPPNPSISAKHDIQLVLDRWQKAFEAKDVNGVMAMYAPGAALTAYDIVPPLQYKGADAYRKDYGEFFAQFDGPLHIEFRDTHLETGSTLAVAYGLEHITGQLKGGAPADMWMVLPSTNHSACTPRECGPDASKCEMSFGDSGLLMSNRSTPAGFRPTVCVW